MAHFQIQAFEYAPQRLSELGPCVWVFGADLSYVGHAAQQVLAYWRQQANGPAAFGVWRAYGSDPAVWEGCQRFLGTMDWSLPQRCALLHLPKADKGSFNILADFLSQIPLGPDNRLLLCSPLPEKNLWPLIKGSRGKGVQIDWVEIPRLSQAVLRNVALNEAKRQGIAIDKALLQQLSDRCGRHVGQLLGLLSYLRDQPELIQSMLQDADMGDLSVQDLAFSMADVLLSACIQQRGKALWSLLRQLKKQRISPVLPLWSVQQDLQSATLVSAQQDLPANAPAALKKRVHAWAQYQSTEQLSEWWRQGLHIERLVKTTELSWAWLALESWIQRIWIDFPALQKT